MIKSLEEMLSLKKKQVKEADAEILELRRQIGINRLRKDELDVILAKQKKEKKKEHECEVEKLKKEIEKVKKEIEQAKQMRLS